MSAIQDDFTTWYIHGMNSGYFKRLGLPQIPTIFQQPELLPLQLPMMYQQPVQAPIMYQQPLQAPIMYQQQTPVEDVKTVIARALDPRVKNCQATDPRIIRVEQVESDEKNITTTTKKVEPYPEHNICIKWLKKEACDGSCNRQHYRYNLFTPLKI